MERSSQHEFIYNNPLYRSSSLYETIGEVTSTNDYTEEQFPSPNHYNTLTRETENNTLPGTVSNTVAEAVEEIYNNTNNTNTVEDMYSLERDLANAMKEYPNELIYELPNDWVQLVAPNGKYYYACKTTKHTQWLHPKIPIGTMMPNGLPYGWGKGTARDGQVYYINHVGRFNTINPPLDLLKRILSSDEENEILISTAPVMNSR